MRPAPWGDTHGPCVRNEGEGYGWLRELQVNGLDFINEIKVKIRSEKEVEMDGRNKRKRCKLGVLKTDCVHGSPSEVPDYETAVTLAEQLCGSLAQPKSHVHTQSWWMDGLI